MVGEGREGKGRGWAIKKGILKKRWEQGKRRERWGHDLKGNLNGKGKVGGLEERWNQGGLCDTCRSLFPFR